LVDFLSYREPRLTRLPTLTTPLTCTIRLEMACRRPDMTELVRDLTRSEVATVEYGRRGLSEVVRCDPRQRSASPGVPDIAPSIGRIT
jgi:hypothetical protein